MDINGLPKDLESQISTAGLLGGKRASAGTGTPYITWFRDGEEQKTIVEGNTAAYDGGRTAQSVIQWAKEKHGAGLLKLGVSGTFDA